MNRLTSLSIAGISILTSSFVSIPAQASLEGILQKKETPYIEISRESRQYFSYAKTNDKYVFQTNSFVNTGISVNRGDKIKIKASGTIRFGAFAGSGGPKGILFDPNYNHFVDIPHGQLIGRIYQQGMGDLDGWFPVGEGGEKIVKTSGILEFVVNDSQPEDNVGNFRVEVTIDSPQAQSGNSAQNQAEHKYIVYDPSPSQCYLVQNNGKSLGKCNKFHLARIVDKKIKLDVLSLTFAFKDISINYAIPLKPIDKDERNGKVFNVYPVVGMFMQKPGEQKAQDLLKEGDRLTCAIASDYSELACRFSESSSILYTR